VRATKLTIVVCLASIAAMVAVTLTKAPPRVVDGVGSNADMTFTTGDFAACQADEVLLHGVSAIRLGVAAGLGPAVHVRAYSGSRVLTQGSRSANWTGYSVTVSVAPLKRTVSHVKLCLAVGPNSGPVYIFGRNSLPQRAAVSAGGQTLPGRVGVEYLAAGSGSWWSRALSVARHMGIGHALSGSWVALLVAVLVGAVAALTTRLAWRELP
jgi:hypothetical protein